MRSPVEILKQHVTNAPCAIPMYLLKPMLAEAERIIKLGGKDAETAKSLKRILTNEIKLRKQLDSGKSPEVSCE